MISRIISCQCFTHSFVHYRFEIQQSLNSAPRQSIKSSVKQEEGFSSLVFRNSAVSNGHSSKITKSKSTEETALTVNSATKYSSKFATIYWMNYVQSETQNTLKGQQKKTALCVWQNKFYITVFVTIDGQKPNRQSDSLNCALHNEQWVTWRLLFKLLVKMYKNTFILYLHTSFHILWSYLS